MAGTTIEIMWGRSIKVPVKDVHAVIHVRNTVIAESYVLHQQGMLTPELSSKAAAILEVTKPFVEEKRT